MYRCMRNSGWWSVFFFIGAVVISRFMLMQFMLAILIYFFDQSGSELKSITAKVGVLINNQNITKTKKDVMSKKSGSLPVHNFKTKGKGLN
jgi:hypothetical protein